MQAACGFTLLTLRKVLLMMKTADAVVIGAGVNGASIAFNLLKQGLKKVVILERYLVASGGTGKSAAIIRQHYSNEPLVRMMKRCIQVFSQFNEIVGGSAGFVNTGWAFLIPEGAVDAFGKNMSMQQSLGIRTKEISRQELQDIEPRFNLDDVAKIAYEPDSGYADPHLTTTSYVQAACSLGGEIVQCNPVTSLTIEKDRVAQVNAAKGSIATNIVVNAAGPWAGKVAAMAGLNIPIQVSREEEILIAPPPGEPPVRLVVSDMAKAIYYRPDASRVLVGRGYPKEYTYVDPDRFSGDTSFEFIDDAAGRLASRMPVFGNALVEHAYTGLYDITPDWHPVLGRTSVDGFFLAAGFSGHGFKLAPAIGELIAEEIVSGRATSIDISGFGLERFEKGRLFAAAYGGNRA